MKNKVLTVIFLFAFTLLSISCRSVLNEAKNKPHISAYNTTMLKIIPDVMNFTVTVRERGTNVDELSKKANSKVHKVVDILKKCGIGDNDISTGSISLSPYYNYYKAKGPAEEEKTYRYHEFLQDINVKIKNYNSKRADDLSYCLSEIAEIDKIEISSFSFDLENNDKWYDTIRFLSSSSLLRKLNSYASGAGMKVGDIITIKENYISAGASIDYPLMSAANQVNYKTARLTDSAFESEAAYGDVPSLISSQMKKLDASAMFSFGIKGLEPKGYGIDISSSYSYSLKPDIAIFSFDVYTRGESTKEISQKGCEIVNNIVKDLYGLGIDPYDISTQSFSVSSYFVEEPKDEKIYYNYHFDQSNIYKYHEFKHSISVCVRNFTDELLGKVFDTIRKNGDEYISIGSTQYDIADNTKVLSLVRENSARQGEKKASSYAKGANVDVGVVLSISESSSSQDSAIEASKYYYGDEPVSIYTPYSSMSNRLIIHAPKVVKSARIFMDAVLLNSNINEEM